MMSVDTMLGEEHEDLGSEFCSGYNDKLGKWNTGFYCPSVDTQALYCCGTPTNKYCCAHREHVNKDDFSSLPLLLGVVMGIIAAISIVTLMSCCFCSCCILYKKRQPTTNGGPLYQLQCSSTASGVANMYSFSNQNSHASTPIDTAVLVDMEPVGRNMERSYMSRGRHTFSCEPEPAPRPDILEDSGTGSSSRLRAVEPPPPYDSPPTYAIREHMAPQQIKRQHPQLPQPPQHPPPLPPVQRDVHRSEQMNGNALVQNSTFIQIQSHGTSVAPNTLRSPSTTEVLEPFSSHMVVSDACASPEGSQDTTSTSESPQSVIKQVLGDIPEETFSTTSTPTPPNSTAPVSTSVPNDTKQVANSNQSYSAPSHCSPSQISNIKGYSQTILRGSPSGPIPPVRALPSVRSVPSGPSPPAHILSQASSAVGQSQQLVPTVVNINQPSITPSVPQPCVSPNSSSKPLDTNVLYHSTKF